jgi:hypothetical protein
MPPFDMEARQRAVALGALVAASSRRVTEFAAEPQSSDGELRWSASTLAAAFLDESTLLARPLDVAEAGALIGRAKVADLQERHLARVIDGRLEPVRTRRYRDLLRALGPDQVESLEELVRVARHEERGRLWLPAERAQLLHRQHAAANADTPSWEEISNASALEPRHRSGQEGFLLGVTDRSSSNWLKAAVSQTAAKLWCLLTTRHPGDDDAALTIWNEKLGDCGAALDAPSHLPWPLRERFVEACMHRVLNDPDLGDLASEEAKQLGGGEVPGELLPRPSVATPASVWLYWEDFDRRLNAEAFDETRHRLHAYLYVILQFDGSGAPTGERFSRIIELAEAGPAKPYLIYYLAITLVRSRPEAIASLLTRASTAPFGLLLLADMDIVEVSMMDGAESRHARVHARRLLLVREAMPLLLKTLANEMSAPTSDAAVVPSLDLLRGLARNVVRQHRSNVEEATRARQRHQEVFDIVVDGLAATPPPYRSFLGGNVEYTPLLFGECAAELVARLEIHFPAGESIEHLTVTQALLRFFREHKATFAAYSDGFRDGLETKVLDIVLRRYVQALKVDDHSSFAYFSRPEALFTLTWLHAACALFEGGRLDEWLSLPQLRTRLSAARAEDKDSANDIVSGAARRLSVHLEILLSLHRRVGDPSGTTDATRNGVRRAVEAAIERLVLARTKPSSGSVSLFDQSLLGIEPAERSRLVMATAGTVLRFPIGSRDRILRRWIERAKEPQVLLDLDKAITAEALRAKLKKRLAHATVVKRAMTDFRFYALVQMVHDAAAANHPELANRLLARGDKVTLRHVWRDQWDKTAFRSRLLLAYHSHDRPAIASLALPASTEGDTQATRDLRATLESSRQFYLALSDLESAPQAAQLSFAAQLAAEPSSSALAVNLFAAELRVAKLLKRAGARRDACEQALLHWERVTSGFTDRDSLEPYGSNNMFQALDGAELDDEFDRRWLALEADRRRRSDLLAVRVLNLVRRGLHEEAARTRHLAEVANGGVLPPELAEVASMQPAAIEDREQSRAAYQKQWNEIRGLPAHVLSHVVGVTESRELCDFLLKTHIDACLLLLRRRESFDLSGDEDRITDILVSFVEMQLLLIGWSSSDQLRGGASATGRTGSAGRRDWVVRSGVRELVVAEALALSALNRAKIQQHATKVANRYNPQGGGTTLVVVYYRGRKFDRFCGRYRSFVATELTIGDWKRESVSANSEPDTLSLRSCRLTLKRGEARVVQDHIVLDLGSADALGTS